MKNIVFTLFSIQKEGLSFNVKVTPKAKKIKIGDVVQDSNSHDAKRHPVLKIAVTEAAEEGKANDAVITLLAKTWHLKKNQFMIKQGASSRNKRLFIAGNAEALLNHLKQYFGQD